MSLLSATPSDGLIAACAIWMMAIPFAFFWLLILFGRTITKYRGITATSLMLVITVLSAYLFFNVQNSEVYKVSWDWIQVGDFKVDFGVRVDALSALFGLIVCFISFLVHLFSIEYLRDDKNFEKYFSYLSLFTFSMLGIIFAQNLLEMFVFWEMVGFSSYLLIGFWHQNQAAVQANKKAFLVNRIGDIGFLMAILGLYTLTHTLDVDGIYRFFTANPVGFEPDGFILFLSALGICAAGLAKSAQLPFSVWLPSAMEGPTPVSALIHAATMVAAGIYLLSRFVFIYPDAVLDLLAIIGSVTAFVAAISAITQLDIKRVLAFSTISQLGYMVLAIGVGSYESALFHLMTHAFFKAALFLCAGAIIHSLHKMDTAYGIKKLYPDFDEQNMKQMGGLRRKIPIIFWVYTVALAGIIGLPFFTGFLSKDAILVAASSWAGSKSLVMYMVPLLAFLTVGLTSFYMLRQWFLVFFHDNRLSKQIKNAPAGIQNFVTKEKLDAPLLMKIPPVILGVLTFAPVFSINPLNASYSWIFKKIPQIQYLNALSIQEVSHGLVSVVSVSLAAVGGLLAYKYYGRGGATRVINFENKTASWLHGLSFHHFYLDDIYRQVIVGPSVWFSRRLIKIDHVLIDGSLQAFALANRTAGKSMAWIDRRIIDYFAGLVGILSVIFAQMMAFFDDVILDGFVKLIALVGMKIGGLSKNIHGGQLQNHVIWSFIFVLIVSLIIWFI